MEPEDQNSIESRLKAYAEQRRQKSAEESGPMPGYMRERLHQEIGRQFAEKPEEPPRWRLFWHLRPVWAVAVLLLIGIPVVAFLMRDERSPTMTLAKTEKQESLKREMPAEPEAAPAASAPMMTEDRRMDSADEVIAAKEQPALQLKQKGDAAAALAARSELKRQSRQSLQFESMESPPMLAQFRMIQDGENVVIMGVDGSTYSGKVVAAGMNENHMLSGRQIGERESLSKALEKDVQQSRNARDAGLLDAPKESGVGSFNDQTQTSVAASQANRNDQRSETYVYLEGTNSLNGEQVQISGKLIHLINDAPADLTATNGLPRKDRSAPYFRGSVTVNGTNVFSLDATAISK